MKNRIAIALLSAMILTGCTSASEHASTAASTSAAASASTVSASAASTAESAEADTNHIPFDTDLPEGWASDLPDLSGMAHGMVDALNSIGATDIDNGSIQYGDYFHDGRTYEISAKCTDTDTGKTVVITSLYLSNWTVLSIYDYYSGHCYYSCNTESTETIYDYKTGQPASSSVASSDEPAVEFDTDIQTGTTLPDRDGLTSALSKAIYSIGIKHIESESLAFGNYKESDNSCEVSVKCTDSDTGKTVIVSMFHESKWSVTDIVDYNSGHYYYILYDAGIVDLYDYKTDTVIKSGVN